jgi:hypothetical protein
MKNARIALSVAAALALLAAPAVHAGPKLSLVTTGTLPMGLTAPAEGRFGFGGGGMLLEFGGSRLGFEVGALYTRLTTAFLAVSDTSTSVVLPALLRLRLGRVITLGAGAYYGYALDDGDRNDHGVQGALGARFPLSKGRSSLLLEGRYQYGLKELPGGYETRGITALLGLSFALVR